MGLDVSHGCWNAPYGAFSRFREELIKASGYVGYEHDIDDTTWCMWYEELKPLEPNMNHFQGIWDEYPEDPLFVFLVHSDCDGFIKADICEAIADRLEEIAPNLPTYGGGALTAPRGPRARAFQWVKGLREAAAAGETVRFG